MKKINDRLGLPSLSAVFPAVNWFQFLGGEIELSLYHKIFEKGFFDFRPKSIAARYNRPALPTEFNNRVREAEPRGNLRNKAKKANQAPLPTEVTTQIQ
jgi:hypothetical protein